MEIIQQIGSYAGFGAVLGLAVLAGLYFSQARDVKRLREWADRIPTRAPYQPPPRVMAQPMRQAPPPPVPTPGVAQPLPPPGVPRPAPAQPAAAGAAAAVATGPLAATPAAARAAAPDAVTQNTVVHPPPRPPSGALPPRPAPPGLGGHFLRDAQSGTAAEDPAPANGESGDEVAADGAGDPGAAPGESPPDERLEGTSTNGERPEAGGDGGEAPEAGGDGGEAPEAEAQAPQTDDEAAEDEHELASAPQLASAYDLASDPDVAALPDPEDFHEGHELVGGPAPGEGLGRRPVAPPLPPPPITATHQPLPARPAPPPRGSRAQPPVLPPYEQSRPAGGSWESRTFSPAKAALAIGTTVVAVGAAAFGVLQLTGGDEPGQTPAPRAATRPAAASKPPPAPAIDPGTVTVSVLNGTTVGGLAAELGDRLQGQGFQLGNVTNNTDQQRAESVVLFAPGAENEAKDVGRRLKIDQREPIDPDSQTRAGDARVVVVAGADLDQ